MNLSRFSADGTEKPLAGGLTRTDARRAVDIAEHALQIKHHKDTRLA